MDNDDPWRAGMIRKANPALSHGEQRCIMSGSRADGQTTPSKRVKDWQSGTKLTGHQCVLQS